LLPKVAVTEGMVEKCQGCNVVLEHSEQYQCRGYPPMVLNLPDH
jgi:hypothetical protein